MYVSKVKHTVGGFWIEWQDETREMENEAAKIGTESDGYLLFEARTGKRDWYIRVPIIK